MSITILVNKRRLNFLEYIPLKLPKYLVFVQKINLQMHMLQMNLIYLKRINLILVFSSIIIKV